MPANSGDSRPPKYCKHSRPDGHDRAYVTIEGKRIYLGRFGSQESRDRYAELIGGEQQDPQPQPVTPSDPTISELILAYIEFAKRYYRTAEGDLAREYGHICEAARYLRREFGHELARQFGPKKLKQVRERLIEKGLTRVHINAQVRRIVGMFRWGVEEELVEAQVHQALTAVRNLMRGRCDAKESRKVKPVAKSVIEATLEHLPEVVCSMVEVQLLTAMRPGELVIMRPCDLDRSGPVWLYQPQHHKGEYRGHDRVIAIGPQAQAILLRYLARDPQDFCFKPSDSETKRLAAREAARVTPLSCGNRRGTNRHGTFKTGERYQVRSYAQAVRRAAARAGVEHWSPHQLRHTAATAIRREFGLDGAQVALGHRNANVTQVYAEAAVERASTIASAVG